MSVDQIEALAAEWLSRSDRGLSPKEQEDLRAWLADDLRHRVAYLRLRANWHRAERLAALRRPAGRVPAPRRSAVKLFAAAACLLIVVAGSSVWFRYAGSSYQTAIGERKDVVLSDGTHVLLNTDTSLRVSLTSSRRVVTLRSGEAYFDVVHDASRPFTVLAGNRRIVDIGTKFSVFLHDSQVRVVVSEGQVRVEPLQGEGGEVVFAQANRELVARPAGNAVIVAKQAKEITDELSWREGMLVFDQKPLSEAAAEFNRYNRRQIQVVGNARDMRIGGRFKADNVDAFVDLLHRGFGLSVNEEDEKFIVSR